MILKSLILLGAIFLGGCSWRTAVPAFLYTDGYRVSPQPVIVVERELPREFSLTLFHQVGIYGFFAERQDRTVAILSEKAPSNSQEAMILFHSARPPRVVVGKLEHFDDLRLIVDQMLQASSYERPVNGSWWLVCNDPIVLAHEPSDEPFATVKHPRRDVELLSIGSSRVSLITSTDLSSRVDEILALDHYPKEPAPLGGQSLLEWDRKITSGTRTKEISGKMNLGDLLQDPSTWFQQ